MTRFILFFALSLAACGGTAETKAPGEADAPHMDHKHDDAMPHDGDAMPVYACPMHPDVTANEPGTCSKCGMTLVQQEAHDHASHHHGEGDEAH